jgi:winged helix DNA-binding protein
VSNTGLSFGRTGLDRTASDVAAAVRSAVAIPATDARAALVSIAARTAGATPRLIERAWSEKHAIVCVTAMRGLNHLVPKDLAPAMLAAYRLSSIEAARRRVVESGVDPRAVAAAELRVLDVVRSSDGPLSVSAISARSQVDPKIAESATVLLLGSGTLLLAGRIGGWRSTMHELDLAERCVPGLKLPDVAEARAKIAGAYIASYGPATLDDFAHWSGFGKPQAKSALVAAGAVLKAGKFDVKPQKPLRKEKVWPGQQVRLLPVVDPVVHAWKNLGRYVPAGRAARLLDKKTAPTGIILAGGKAIGTWTFREGPKPWAARSPGSAIQHEWESLRQAVRSGSGVTV